MTPLVVKLPCVPRCPLESTLTVAPLTVTFPLIVSIVNRVRLDVPVSVRVPVLTGPDDSVTAALLMVTWSAVPGTASVSQLVASVQLPLTPPSQATGTPDGGFPMMMLINTKLGAGPKSSGLLAETASAWVTRVAPLVNVPLALL